MNRWILIACLGLLACEPELKETSYDPAGATDTRDKPVQHQVKQIFRPDEGKVSFSNDFPGGRLTAVESNGSNSYTLDILPENQPINKSPWFAFQAWAERPDSVTLTLRYPGFRHRYIPKLSTDGRSWSPLDSSAMTIDTASGTVRFRVFLQPAPLWIAAQELLPSDSVYAWEQNLVDKHGGTKVRIGFSKLGKPIYMSHFGELSSRQWIVVLGRQHPPEVSGYVASQAFMETLLAETDLAKAFRSRFRIAMVPMLNPDGIDLGHWRHSAAGIDLNRDWAAFHQPETRAVRDYLLPSISEGIQVPFAIDFHSTDSDMYYVFSDDMQSHLQGFTGKWLDRM